jgi:hypothetical protein
LKKNAGHARAELVHNSAPEIEVKAEKTAVFQTLSLIYRMWIGYDPRERQFPYFGGGSGGLRFGGLSVHFRLQNQGVWAQMRAS